MDHKAAAGARQWLRPGCVRRQDARMDVAGIILAGGASRRMQAGGAPIDKALLPLGGRPMICLLYTSPSPRDS